MNREAALPFCVYKSVDFDLCMTSTGEENLRKGKHIAYLPKSRYRRLFDHFCTPTTTLFRSLRSVTGTGYQDHPETLLAVVGTATANLVVLPSTVLSQEEGPLLTPFLAPAHRLPCSGVPRPSRAFSGVGLSAHSRFASARRSRMEGFSFTSSRRPLLICPSIIA